MKYIVRNSSQKLNAGTVIEGESINEIVEKTSIVFNLPLSIQRNEGRKLILKGSGEAVILKKIE